MIKTAKRIGKNGEGKMEMKDRVDNFLKVAGERVKENTENIREFNDLCGSLTSLIKDKELQDYLFTEYMKITDEADLVIWDERFLNVIAGEHEESDEEKLNRLNHQYSQGRGKIRMGAGAGTVTLSGAGTGATWSNQPTQILTTPALQQAAHQLLHDQQKQQLQDFKDELRAKRK